MARLNLAMGFALLYLFVGKQKLTAQNRSQFTEGIVYSKVSFPVHPVQPVLTRIDFNKDDIPAQYHKLKDSFLLDVGALPDPMFMSFIFLSPVSVKSTFAKNRALIESQSLAYQSVNLVINDTAKLVIRPFNNDEPLAVIYDTPSMKKVWEKYEINENEFTIQKTTETDVIAAYPCKKIIFNFNGTSRQVLPTKLIGNIPWKVTVWYSEVFPPSINAQLPLYFNLPHGILKTQVEFDKAGKNKMIYEVTKIVPKEVGDGDFKITSFVLPLKYPEQSEKITTTLMSIAANALQNML